jgi:exodeoxyribonuclease-3
LGYEAVWQGEHSWNGVTILARHVVPVLTCSTLPGNPEDHQARYIEAAVNGLLITSIYLPNGNPQPGPKFAYKLAWFELFIAHAAELLAANVPVILAGDYNVVPTPQDVYPTRSLDNNALIQPESRKAFARLLAQGWTDAMRKLQPNGPLWTFWDYKREQWPNDKVMRLDHFLLSPQLSECLVDGNVDRWVRGEAKASDHAPDYKSPSRRVSTKTVPVFPIFELETRMVPAVLFLDVLRQPEAQAGAGFLLGCEECLEDSLSLLDRYSHSVVGDGDPHCRAGTPDADVQGASSRRILLPQSGYIGMKYPEGPQSSGRLVHDRCLKHESYKAYRSRFGAYVSARCANRVQRQYRAANIEDGGIDRSAITG